MFLRLFLFLVLLANLSVAFSQTPLEIKEAQLREIQTKERAISDEIEALKLQDCVLKLNQIGIPLSQSPLDIAEHSAMIIGFNCDLKLAAWSFHVLSPDVLIGGVSRTNDFRKDSLIECGDGIEQDYFRRIPKDDGTVTFENFGFDRGHLAPSADFRWSQKALSESYFYSNMTPQAPGFNRESWAEVEDLMRRIMANNPKTYYIVTGPILDKNLPKVEKGTNKLPIPAFHYKIIIDLTPDNQKGMAFLMPNKKCDMPPSAYVVSIDSIEKLTGLDFFSKLDKSLAASIESKANFSLWNAQTKEGDVEPLYVFDLPKGYFNTAQALSKVGSKVSIIGKVVSAKFAAKSQATFLNLDQSFPHQLFTVTIWKDARRNFSYKPENDLNGKYIVVTGLVEMDKNGLPVINVTNEKQIKLWEEEEE
jgi:endonuclease G